MYKEKRIKARELRENGWTVTKIALELKVAKSSVSLWVRDISQPEHFTKEFLKRKKELNRKKKRKRVTKKSYCFQYLFPPSFTGCTISSYFC